MDDLKLLSDDHSLLSSQVLHLVALLKALVEGRFESAALHADLNRLADLLNGQLIEHFEFEEQCAFPRLEELFPSRILQLQSFVAEHDQILDAFEEMRAGLNLDVSQLRHASVLSKASYFESVFRQHTTSETQLFQELAKEIGERTDEG